MLLDQFRSEADASPYVFLSIERLAVIRDAVEAGQFGANYELVNNLHRWFDRIQEAGRTMLAERNSLKVEDLAWPRGTIHDLRRTYGTRIARIVPIHVLKEYMGHAKIQTTQEYYLAAEAADAKATRRALDSLVTGEVDSPS